MTRPRPITRKKIRKLEDEKFCVDKMCRFHIDQWTAIENYRVKERRALGRKGLNSYMAINRWLWEKLVSGEVKL